MVSSGAPFGNPTSISLPAGPLASSTRANGWSKRQPFSWKRCGSLRLPAASSSLGPMWLAVGALCSKHTPSGASRPSQRA
eukprot:7827537-Alexandrium_andersonii.AAC.1